MFSSKSNELLANQLREDPRVAEAKRLLLEATTDCQKKLTGIRGPHKDLIVPYEEILTAFAQYRGGKLYFPYLGSGFGNGALVELLDGSVKYDMISGIGVHYWGHNHPDLLMSSVDAAISDTVMQGHLQQNVDAVELSSTLIQASGLDHCFLSSSGVMANENALKIAFQNKYPASRLLAFERCFMGRTLVLSQVTDKPAFREGLPHNIFVDYVPFYQADRPEESTKEAVHVLKKHLARYPKQHAAMCFEFVQGEAGFYPGNHDFFAALMQVLKEHEVAIIADEVQTFGRTPHLFAFQYFQLDDYIDIVTIGKLSQTCGTLFRSNFKPRPGLLSQTFTSSTSAIFAAKVIVNSLLHHDYLGPEGKIAQIHDEFVKKFKLIEEKYPDHFKGPYGIGAMIAFTPFNGEPNKVATFIQDLFHAGVISFTAGSQPARVRFLVPIGAITFKDVEAVTSIIEEVLRKNL